MLKYLQKQKKLRSPTVAKKHYSSSNLPTKEIRERYLKFFGERGHERVASSKLVPNLDTSLLFTNSGMVQFKDLFTGREKRHYNKAVSVQKCVRAGGKHNDLENVGYTARHHTFFEMLGNFSFGAYFKEEAIDMAWKFVTKELQIPKEKLSVTVFETDDESAKIWKSITGFDDSRITRKGKKDNFWSMGDVEGPCGPCTEIFYDQEFEDVDGERFLEIWNLVFMQYYRDQEGNLSPLSMPCVDTGMGLERVASVVQGKKSNYETDGFANLISNIHGKVQQYTPGAASIQNPLLHPSLRVIADHIRSSSFIIADGVYPSSTGRGYVLRSIIRRTVRHLQQLGVKQPMLPELFDFVLHSELSSVYPELNARANAIRDILRNEEIVFLDTLQTGTTHLEKEIQKMKKVEGKKVVISGDLTFYLRTTLGLPLDIIKQIATDKGWEVDEKKFEKIFEDSKKNTFKDMGRSGLAPITEEVRWWKEHNVMPTFVGYEQEVVNDAKVLAVTQVAEEATTGDSVMAWVAIEPCPFYAESGGQVGDRGSITLANGTTLNVLDAQRPYEGGLAILVQVPKQLLGSSQDVSHILKIGNNVRAEVNTKLRKGTKIHHTATHLLHAALRKVLGSSVNQAGSVVTPTKLRFDFTHGSPVTQQQLQEIENLINAQVNQASAVECAVMPKEQAFKAGALHLFDEKYPDVVRVVNIPEISMELCGGTHVSNLGDIYPFKIVSEESVAAGTRRIEAIAGSSSVDLLLQHSAILKGLCQPLGATRIELIPERATKITEKATKLEKQNEKLKSIMMSSLFDANATSAINGAIQFPAKKSGELTSFPIKLHNIQEMISKAAIPQDLDIDGTLSVEKLQQIAKSDTSAVHLIFNQGRVVLVGGLEGFDAAQSIKYLFKKIEEQKGWKASGGGDDKIARGKAGTEETAAPLFQFIQSLVSAN